MNENQPAFPTWQSQDGGAPPIAMGGMSLRDYFAAKAMDAILTINGTSFFEDRARTAYKMADAMLTERNKV